MSQNKYTILFLLILLFCSFLLIGCPDNQSNLGSANEDFVGTYMTRDSALVESLSKIDSIRFSIERSTTYSIQFFQADSLDEIDFCDHSGTILDFGTGKASFDPTSILYNNCDTLNIPRGTYVADFINHGDTVWIYKNVSGVDNSSGKSYDSLYIMKFLQ